jgi:hypothetical protein
MPWLEWIERVEFGDIDHLSFKTHFGNFTSVSTEAPLGETMKLTITPAFSWEVFEEYFRAWIDFNQDGDFEDAGEMVLEAAGTAAVSADISIPHDAVLGPVRMRVAMQRGQYPEQCEDFLHGEVQDYTVIFVQADNWSPDNENTSGKSSLKLSPNPAKSTLAVRFSTKHSGPVRMQVMSAGGANLINERFNLLEGDHYIELDISTLPAGTYHLLLHPVRQKLLAGAFVKME